MENPKIKMHDFGGTTISGTPHMDTIDTLLVHNSITVAYGIYDDMLFMRCIKQQTSLGGATLYGISDACLSTFLEVVLYIYI